MSEWQTIETAPKGVLLLFFPEIKSREGRGGLPAMMRVENYPVAYPRKPTHWLPLPEPPK